MNAEQSILKHVGLAGVLKGYGIYDNVITAMEDYAQERVKNCSIPAVINRRELLVAFLCEYHTSMLVFAEMPDIETIVDDYLKSN